jgi:hypothetical protein
MSDGMSTAATSELRYIGSGSHKARSIARSMLPGDCVEATRPSTVRNSHCPLIYWTVAKQIVANMRYMQNWHLSLKSGHLFGTGAGSVRMGLREDAISNTYEHRWAESQNTFQSWRKRPTTLARRNSLPLRSTTPSERTSGRRASLLQYSRDLSWPNQGNLPHRMVAKSCWTTADTLILARLYFTCMLVMPTPNRSSGNKWASVICSPLTSVPFLDSRSRTTSVPSSMLSSQWTRLAQQSTRRTSASAPRPMTAGSSSTTILVSCTPGQRLMSVIFMVLGAQISGD